MRLVSDDDSSRNTPSILGHHHSSSPRQERPGTGDPGPLRPDTAPAASAGQGGLVPTPPSGRPRTGSQTARPAVTGMRPSTVDYKGTRAEHVRFMGKGAASGWDVPQYSPEEMLKTPKGDFPFVSKYDSERLRHCCPKDFCVIGHSGSESPGPGAYCGPHYQHLTSFQKRGQKARRQNEKDAKRGSFFFIPKTPGPGHYKGIKTDLFAKVPTSKRKIIKDGYDFRRSREPAPDTPGPYVVRSFTDQWTHLHIQPSHVQNRFKFATQRIHVKEGTYEMLPTETENRPGPGSYFGTNPPGDVVGKHTPPVGDAVVTIGRRLPKKVRNNMSKADRFPKINSLGPGPGGYVTHSDFITYRGRGYAPPVKVVDRAAFMLAQLPKGRLAYATVIPNEDVIVGPGPGAFNPKGEALRNIGGDIPKGERFRQKTQVKPCALSVNR